MSDTTPSPSASERAERVASNLTDHLFCVEGFGNYEDVALVRRMQSLIANAIASAITAAEQAARPQWLPIESAPKDTRSLFVWANGEISISRNQSNGLWYPEPPIAWMPLPEPPSKEMV